MIYKNSLKIILIVGASGAGKDTLLRGAKKILEDKNINFIKRHITRKPDENEDNHYLSEDDMKRAAKMDKFLSLWKAHGNTYAVARNMLEDGKNIISVSRDVIEDFEDKFENVVVINITADEYSLKQRILSRKREKNTQERLAQMDKKFSAKNIINFHNEGDVNENIKKFAQILEEI